MRILVSDVMTADMITCQTGTALEEVARLLLDNQISSIVVKDGEQVVGIVTERDFLKTFGGGHPLNVEDIMVKEMITIESDQPVLDSTMLMGEHRIRHVLVRKGGRIAGILSLRDVLRIIPDAIYGYESRAKSLDDDIKSVL